MITREEANRLKELMDEIRYSHSDLTNEEHRGTLASMKQAEEDLNHSILIFEQYVEALTA